MKINLFNFSYFNISTFLFGDIDKIEHPFTVKKYPVKKTVVKKEEKVNLTYDKFGRAFVREELENGGFSDELYNGKNKGRSSDLTKNDLTIIADRGLKEAKYRQLKVFWASGYTAVKVTRESKGKRGFGQRTIEQYWSAMNAAYSPTE